jgi:hypothetical protein
LINYNLIEKILPAAKSKYRKRAFKTSSGKSYKVPTSGSRASVRPNVNWFKDDEGRNTLDHLSMTLHKGDIKKGNPDGPKSHAAHAVVLADVNLHPDVVINHSSRKRALSKGLNKKGFPYKDPHAFAHGKVVSGGRSPKIDSIKGMKRLKYDIVQGYYHLESDKEKKPVVRAKEMVAISDHNPLGVRGGFYVRNVKHAKKNSQFDYQTQEESYAEDDTIELILDEEAYGLLCEGRDTPMTSLNEAIETILHEGDKLGPVYEIDRIRNMLINFGYNPMISGIEFAKASAAGNQVFEHCDGSKVSICITGTDKTHGTWTFESKMKTKAGKSKKALELLLLNHAMGDC